MLKVVVLHKPLLHGTHVCTSVGCLVMSTSFLTLWLQMRKPVTSIAPIRCGNVLHDAGGYFADREGRCM